MRAVVVKRHGGPDVLTVSDWDEPQPGPGELLVDVTAAGVNFVDVYHRAGAYPTQPPFVPGVEGAGTVAAVGEGVLGVEPGDRVTWAMTPPGAYAERALVPAAKAVPIPLEMPDELAAAALLQGMTAHFLTHASYPVQAGDTVLVHAAAGGTGLLITQLVRLRGGHVIGTVSTEEKERLAREAGADEVIRYDHVDVADAVTGITNGVGVAAVFDGVGRSTFDASLASLRPRGVLVLFGYASGRVPPFDLHRLETSGSVFVTRPSLRHHMASREELLERAGDVLSWVESGAVRVRIGERYRLEDASQAHADLEGRRTSGKLLLLPA
jgi:NADPH:quinone reductase